MVYYNEKGEIINLPFWWWQINVMIANKFIQVCRNFFKCRVLHIHLEQMSNTFECPNCTKSIIKGGILNYMNEWLDEWITLLIIQKRAKHLIKPHRQNKWKVGWINNHYNHLKVSYKSRKRRQIQLCRWLIRRNHQNYSHPHWA